ncbi:uncharacterized protein TNCV_1671591 [Trichonephila clavipes]|nr:uncharacterized protein TNCV_1671591 [Trichonephila clavipes]
MHYTVNFRKIYAQLIPSQLTAEQRNTWNVLSLSHLQLYHEEEYGFPSQIVTGDETWGHHFEPESKRQSKQWKRASSPPPKKSKVTHTSPGKVMMSFLFTTRAYRLSSFWNRKPPSSSVIKPHNKT